MRCTARTAGVAVAAVALVFSLVACGSSSDAPAEAQPQPPLTAHPCDAFGPEAQAAAGIGGKTPRRYDDREIPFQRRECSFLSRTPDSSVLVSFNAFPISDVDEDERFTRLKEITIAGHRAVLDDFPGGAQCLASVDFDPGVLEVMVGYPQGDIETREQACPLALEIAQGLGPYFPEHL